MVTSAMQLIKILLVEDDPGHALLIEKNLRRAGITDDIILINNGQSALDYLEANSCEQRKYGLLILLDLNLPVLNGFEVLERIKSDERTRKIPVIILTTTDVPQEIARCYELGCNIFITKPVQYDEFCTAVHNLGLLLSILKFP
jgi:CheY-like chemotaxis protein